MSKKEITTAGIIIIGSEVLSGRIQDANVQHIALKLNQHGVHLREVRIIPDLEEQIIETVRFFHKAYDYVFTTGGIGPTHDDITAESVAKAFNREVEYNEKALEILYKRYGTENLTVGRKLMARMPKNVDLIKNPVTSAPGFQIENVFVMAGIPLVMQGMLDGILDRIVADHPILSTSVSCNLAEGDLAMALGELQQQVPEVDIGSYPFWRQGHFGTSIVIRGQVESIVIGAARRVSDLIVSLGGIAEKEVF